MNRRVFLGATAGGLLAAPPAAKLPTSPSPQTRRRW
jgi:hypothetical protein